MTRVTGASPLLEGFKALAQEDDRPSGMRLDVGKYRGFWQISIGNVIAMLTILFGLMGQYTGLVSHYSVLQSQGATMLTSVQTLQTQVQVIQNDVVGVKSEVNELKTSMDEMRSWRDRQETENRDWKSSIETTLDGLTRHLERLDWVVERPGMPPPVPPSLSRRH